MSRRVIVIGLDCLSPKLTSRFAEEGAIPNMKRLMNEGSFVKVLPCFPAWTPTNWTSVATGAYPGTHGVFAWGTHRVGFDDETEERRWAMSSSACRAEYVWETAAREGLSSVLFYFVGYPQTTEKAVHLDWLMSPGAYYFEISRAACYATTGRGSVQVDFTPAREWRNLPDMGIESLEAEIDVEPKIPGEGPKYHLLLTGTRDGYTSLLISKEKDFDRGKQIRPGEWTKWSIEEFHLGEEKVLGSVRFKLVELSGDAEAFRLYRSQVYPLNGFSVPPDLSGELVEQLGPYVNDDAGHAFSRGWIDWKTVQEELEYQIAWIGKASRSLMKSTGASLYFIHWHLLDTLQHHCLGQIDPAGAMYDPNRAKKAWDVMRKGFALADRLVGELAAIADEETSIVVVSDHGNSPNRKRVSLINLFLRKGWMATAKDPEGRIVVDRARSRVWLNSLHIHVNLQGRERNGIVTQDEYEEFRNQILHELRHLRDPADGEPAIELALRREDAGIMGMWGDAVGDVIFCYSPGHAWTGPEVLKMGEDRVIFESGGANHGPQPPWTETEVSSNYATLILKGPGVKSGHVQGPSDPRARMVDIAPTICHLVDIPTPRDSEGRVLQELLEGRSPPPERPPRPDLEFPELPPRGGPPKFKGDVTDEI